MIVNGQLYLPAQSKAYASRIERLSDGGLRILSEALEQDLEVSQSEYQLEDRLAGLPQQIRFTDGSLFVTDRTSSAEIDRWFAGRHPDGKITWWESHWLALVLAIVLTPLVIWWSIAHGIPMAAHASVRFIPDIVPQKIGDQTLSLLEEYELRPSALPEDQQQAIRAHWQASLTQLGWKTADFDLLFRQSDLFENNAFALPNNTIVITDSLIHLLESNPDAILAVLLHETGHLVHQHGLKSLTESFAITLAVAFLIGDVDATGDTFVSVGSGVVNSAFSRDLEREADQFALASLQQLGLPTHSFTNAMKSLAKHHGLEEQEQPWYLQLFSSHPSTVERIRSSEQDQ